MHIHTWEERSRPENEINEERCWERREGRALPLLSSGLWIDCFLWLASEGGEGWRMWPLPGEELGIQVLICTLIHTSSISSESCRFGKLIALSPSIRPSDHINYPCHLLYKALLQAIGFPTHSLFCSLSLSLSCYDSAKKDTSLILSQATEPSCPKMCQNVIKVW